MPLITFQFSEPATPEDILYVKEIVKKADITIGKLIEIILPEMIMELTNNVTFELLLKFLMEYYLNNQEEFIETGLNVLDAERITEYLIDDVIIKTAAIKLNADCCNEKDTEIKE